MKGHQHAVRQEDFDALLGLFSRDKDEAGREYERMRSGLVRFFEFRGCSDADDLADETLNRVALKAGAFNGAKDVKLSSYVYGFALNVFLEYVRSPRHREFVSDTDDFLLRVQAAERSDDDEPMFDCLESCLNKLARTEREMFVEYYSRERREKIETRKKLAERLGCTIEALHTRVFRLKLGLRSCVTACVGQS